MLSQELIETGLFLGFLHVALGPDHLSALATLSVGSSFKAFSLGVRWGLGHSTGLVTIAVAFIAMKGNIDLRRLAGYINVVLGIFMMVIGCSGIIGAFNQTSATSAGKRKKQERCHEGMEVNIVPTVVPTTNNNPFSNSRHKHTTSDIEKCIHPSSPISKETDDSSRSSTTSGSEIDIMGMEDHLECCGTTITSASCGTFLDMRDPWTQKVLSFSIGILHGAAGPGAILGVLPAVEMQSWTASFTYLSAFVLSSTLCMGIFAALYGEITKRLGATADCIELGLRVFSSSCSVVVGALWLTLSALGKLDAFFH